MTSAAELDGLATIAMELTEVLDDLPMRLDHGSKMRMWHRDFALRAPMLAGHLRSVLVLVDAEAYPSAFTLIRTALEHLLLDRLLFLGTRYETSYDVPGRDWPAEEARLVALRDGPRPDLVDWRFQSGRVTVTVRGYFLDGRLGKPPILSPYYLAFEHHDPFTGPADLQGQLAGGFEPLDDRTNAAVQARGLWYRLMTWGSILRNLTINRLARVTERLRLEVHYSFLSGFAHPSALGYRATRSDQPLQAHCLRELALIYVVDVACQELRAFERMARRRPVVRVRSWGETVAPLVVQAEVAVDHGWFLSGSPQPIDRIAEAHTRVGRPKSWPPNVPDPAAAARVRYYSNPLRRLVRMHEGFHELVSGISYASPFGPL